MSHLLKYGVFYICLLLSGIANAQLREVYMDAGVGFNKFYNTGTVALEDKLPALHCRAVGFGFGKKDSRFQLKAELATAPRSYQRVLSDSTYLFKFLALQANILGEYEVLEKFNAELGFSFVNYSARLRGAGPNRELGSGFKRGDVMSVVGLNYGFFDFIYIGSRYSYGWVKMLEYTPIDNYGNFLERESILNCSTLEFFIRLKFYNAKRY